MVKDEIMYEEAKARNGILLITGKCGKHECYWGLTMNGFKHE